MAVVSANPDPSAHRVGDLVLRRWLAQGGMAELYLATPADPARAHEVVVLKRVLPQFSSSSNFVRMFAREARLASMLRHPNIVEVHAAQGLGAEDCFFTMEYVHGIDLGDLLDLLRAKGGAMPLAHALTIAIAMCAGLHYAHEAVDPSTGQPLGIVHRDVSPSNVLLGLDGAIKVTDFGVAKALAMTRLTEEGTRKGKLAYMSPEQATGETVDRRADVFAIATVLYELTTMKRLFDGDNDLAVMYAILNRPRPVPREVSPGYPAALEAIVMRAVSKDIDERYPDALSLQRDLEGFAASVGLPLSAPAVGAFVQQTVPPRLHPRDDPELMASVTPLRASVQRAPTSVEVSGSGATQADPWASLGTGPNPAAPLVSHSAIAAASAPGAVRVSSNPGTPSGPMASMSMPANWAPPEPESRLQTWSLGLAAAALVVAVGVAGMVWFVVQDDAEPESPAPTESKVPAAAPREPTPAPAVAPSPVPTPSDPVAAQPPAPAPNPAVGPAAAEAPAKRRRKGGRRTKKNTPPVVEPTPTPAPTPTPTPKPAPPPPPASKKPSPTDTLLPIRE